MKLWEMIKYCDIGYFREGDLFETESGVVVRYDGYKLRGLSSVNVREEIKYIGVDEN